MPYFIYKIRPVKQLEKVSHFEKFREAKIEVKAMRKELDVADNYVLKIIFAKNEIEAELLLKETREARPLGDD